MSLSLDHGPRSWEHPECLTGEEQAAGRMKRSPSGSALGLSSFYPSNQKDKRQIIRLVVIITTVKKRKPKGHL